MSPSKFLNHFTIKIGGQLVSELFMALLEEIVVDSSLHLPDMFTLRFRDPDFKLVDDSLLDIGKEVEISVETDEESGGLSGTLIKGEITALEPHFSAAWTTTILVRGYDKSHRLHRGRQTRTFMNKTDSDLASTIAGEAGLSAMVDTTSVSYPWILQYNQTNMEFLLSRAERIGYQVFVADGKLHFKKGDYTRGGSVPELAYGEELMTFQPRFTASHQSDQMIVHGWDAKGKAALTSTKTPNSGLNQGGMSQTGGDKAKSAFSAASEIVVDDPVATVNEANALADGLSNDISREFVQAEGVCAGDPRVLAGTKIKIQNVGTRFSGHYFVTAATHVYTANGYETRFSITGRHPNTLSYLLNSGNGHGPAHGLVQGVVTAQVTNLTDPDDLGRVKVKYPWMPLASGAEIESDWVRVAPPMAGAERGLLYLPEIDDEVLIAFEHGNVHRPYIVGALWSTTDKPPEANATATADGKVNQRILKTRAGHLVILDDKQGEEQISVTSKSGHQVILNDKSGSESITVKDKTGNNSMVIDSSQNSMTINVDGDFNVTAKGKVTIKSTGNMTLDSSANGTVKSGGNMTVQSTGNMEAKATGNLSLKGTGMTELKGNMTTVDGGPMTTIKGGLVKIN